MSTSTEKNIRKKPNWYQDMKSQHDGFFEMFWVGIGLWFFSFCVLNLSLWKLLEPIGWHLWMAERFPNIANRWAEQAEVTQLRYQITYSWIWLVSIVSPFVVMAWVLIKTGGKILLQKHNSNAFRYLMGFIGLGVIFGFSHSAILYSDLERRAWLFYHSNMLGVSIFALSFPISTYMVLYCFVAMLRSLAVNSDRKYK